MADLEQKLEALLFVAGEPLALDKAAKFLKEEKSRVQDALARLEKELLERGLRLAEKDGQYALVTAPELGKFVQSFVKEEISQELSRAALETLAVIVYKGPTSRSEIDYIRGVNSAWTVRNLMVRGLVERVAHPRDLRIWLYRPSFDFLKFMGVEKLEKLPQYNEFRKEIAQFMQTDHGGDA